MDDLYSLKDIHKNAETKDSLLDILKSLQSEGVLKLNEKGDATILLSEEFTVYNFINVPNKMGKEELIAHLQVNEADIKRIYKQSLYWFLVSENPQLEALIKTIKFDTEDLKYDITTSKMIRRQLMKKIQHFNYIKETDDLKASSPNNNRKDSIVKEKSERYNSNVSNTSEHFSWRKKSDLSTNSKDE